MAIKTEEQKVIESCGCEVKMSVEQQNDHIHYTLVKLEFCPLHAKAQEMYEALKPFAHMFKDFFEETKYISDDKPLCEHFAKELGEGAPTMGDVRKVQGIITDIDSGGTG